MESTIERWFSHRFCCANAEETRSTRCGRAISGLDLTDALAAIRRPTPIMVGEDGPGTPVAAHRVIHERIAGSELVVIADALHLSNVGQADAFNAALTASWRGIEENSELDIGELGRV